MTALPDEVMNRRISLENNLGDNFKYPIYSNTICQPLNINNNLNTFWGIREWNVDINNMAVSSNEVIDVRKNYDDLHAIFSKLITENKDKTKIYSIVPVKMSF